MKLEDTVSIDDVRELARRRLPSMIFNFVDGGAEDEVTLRANLAAFDDVTFKPKVMVDVRSRELTTTLAGGTMSAPIILAPAGLTRVVHPDGELAVARAAAKQGVPYAVSAWSTYTIEELAEAGAEMWFEVWPMPDEELRSSLIARAKACDYRVLVYMVDAPIGGRRERELKRGIGFPPRYTLRNIIDGARHPSWGLGWMRSAHMMAPRNINGAGGHRTLLPKVPSMHPFAERMGSPAGEWDDLRRTRDRWHGPLAVKGIITADDASRAVECGADIIMISNHGGRQLDGLPPTLSVLAEICTAVAGRAEVVIDGGIRRGTHIAKCLALGARAVAIGRPYHYGLGAAGQPGVERVIEMLKDELSRTMGLLGVTAVDQIDATRVG